VDGQSLAEGSGVQVHQMTVREGVNLAYFHLVRDMRTEDRAARMAGCQFEDTLEDRIKNFEEKIGLRPAHEDLALWMHKHVMLPAQGYTPEQIAAMFNEEAGAQLPAGVGEEDRWRFEDEEWDGLKDFQGNPWELPGLSRVQAAKIKAEHEEKNREFL
jgi:hypothetical protein